MVKVNTFISADTFANSADPEPSHQDLHYLPSSLLIFHLNPYLQRWMCLNSEREESILEIQGWKC